MASLLDSYGPTALITGAASGIGRAFAGRLCAAGFGLILCDRDAAGLATLRSRLRAEGCEPELLAGDLTDDVFVASVAARLGEADVGLLVHSAGITSMGEFVDIPLEQKRREVALHCGTTLELAHAATVAMRARGRGGVILLSSNSALLSSPFVANYAATKAYTLGLAEALYEELRGHGVDVLGLAPGMTQTALLEASRPDTERSRGLIASPEAVADAGLAALGRTPMCLTSGPDKLAAFFFQRMLTRRAKLSLARRSMTYLFFGR